MKRRKFVRNLAGTTAGMGLANYSAVSFPGIQLKKTSSKMYDVIVIGVGSMGSATCYQLSKKGVKVLGLEQFGISHDRGSHAGQSRIIRKAYFEHPDYVPLLESAYHGWSTIENESGIQLYYPVGLAYFGNPEEELLTAVKQSANMYNVALNELSREESENKFPQFSLPSNYEAVFEAEAGFLTPEKSILTMANLATQNGADIRTRTPVQSWSATNDGVEVVTDNETFKAKKLIICSGAYTNVLVKDMQSKLKVTRQLISWVQPNDWENFEMGNFPCWVMTHKEFPGMFYGFPILPIDGFMGPVGMKIAHHYGGEPIPPEQIHDFSEEKERKKIMEFMNDAFPGVFKKFLEFKSCLYTYSPDDDFIIDFLPEHGDNVAVACGFSGHGFKFAPIVGEILSDLALEGKTDHPIEFLRMNRDQ